jgi:D-3-phosphoglycerate dehydrogenase
MPIIPLDTLVLEPEGYSRDALGVYGRLGRVSLGETTDPEATRILVVRLRHIIDARVLDRYPKLRAVVSPTTGLNHIDLDECRRRGIRVFSLADCREAIEEVTSTSELALGLMIALLRNIPRAAEDVVRHGRWDRDAYRSRQLSRLTLGIVGLGRLGGHVCRYAGALGMKVFAHDPHQPEERFRSLAATRAGLVPLLEAADIVSIHAALRVDNYGLIGRAELACMKTQALIVNTARGELVDEQAVADALRAGRLGGYAADVLSGERGTEDWLHASPLHRAAAEGLNVLITPHLGGCTSDAMHVTEEGLARFVFESFERGPGR